MNKKKQLIGMVGILIVLCGGLYIVKAEKEPQEVEEVVEEEAIVLSLKEEEMKKLTIKNETEEVVLTPVKETIENEDAEASIYYTWQMEMPYEVEVEQDTINTIGERLLYIEASQEIESSDLGSFGLEKPSMTIHYETLEGEAYNLSVGNETVDGASYYVMLNEIPDKIYVIDNYLMNDVSPRTEDYRNKMLGTMHTDTLTTLKISGKDRETYEIQNIESGLIGTLEGTVLLAPNETPIQVEAEAYQALLSELPTLQVESFVEEQALDLAVYGLDEPSLMIEVGYTEIEESETPVHKKEIFKWGNETEDGLIYFTIGDEKAVYTMESSFIKPLEEKLDVFKLSDKFICMANISEVEGVEVKIGETVYHLSIERTQNTIPATESEEEKIETEETYLIDGKEIEEDRFKSIYQQIIAVIADTQLKNEKVANLKEPVITITYSYNDGTTKEIDYYDYDERFYSTVIGNQYVVGCNRKQFDSLKQALEDTKE